MKEHNESVKSAETLPSVESSVPLTTGSESDILLEYLLSGWDKDWVWSQTCGEGRLPCNELSLCLGSHFPDVRDESPAVLSVIDWPDLHHGRLQTRLVLRRTHNNNNYSLLWMQHAFHTLLVHYYNIQKWLLQSEDHKYISNQIKIIIQRTIRDSSDKRLRKCSTDNRDDSTGMTPDWTSNLTDSRYLKCDSSFLLIFLVCIYLRTGGKLN